MSDRRRNLFVLLAVLGLIAASAAVVATKSTRLGLDLQGGVQLVYEARPTKQQPTVTPDGLDRALDIMRDRVDALGVAEPELQRSGDRQIDVSLPGVKNAERAADQVGTTAQMYFYDWEPNILDEDCKTNPERVDGGQQAISGLYNAVKRASKCPPDDRRNNTTAGLFYAFDKKSHEPINDGIPEENRADLERDLDGAEPDRQRRDPRGPRGRSSSLRAVDEREPDGAEGQGRQLVGHRGQPGPQRLRHQEPGAELRERHRRPADRHDGVQRQGPQGVRRDDARDRPARRRQLVDQRRPAEPDRRLALASRSGSTTS